MTWEAGRLGRLSSEADQTFMSLWWMWTTHCGGGCRWVEVVKLPTAARETMCRLGGVLRAGWLPQAASTSRFAARAATSQGSRRGAQANSDPK